MIVSICPTFLCNQRCKYCFLGNLRNDKHYLDCSLLNDKLNIINDLDKITSINIFGGEVSLLSKDYLNHLNDVCKLFTDNITVTTNFHNQYIADVFDNISFSYNEERPDYEQIKQLLPYYEKEYSLSIVVLPSIINANVKELLDSINYYNCKNITFQKYSPALLANNNYQISDEEYMKTLINIIDYYLDNANQYYFNVSNVKDIANCLRNDYNPKMDANIFINHQGEYGYIKYNKNNLEFYEWCDTIDAYKDACNVEKQHYQKCINCQYFNRCYAEHLNFNVSCCGHKELLKHYEGRL